MRILVLTHRFPFPPNKGDRIRTFHFLKHLNEQATVDLATLAHEPFSPTEEQSLQQYCDQLAIVPINPVKKWLNAFSGMCTGRSLTAGLFRSKKLRSQVIEWASAEQYDAVVAFCSSMEQYLSLPTLSDIPKIVDFIDVDSHKWQDYADASSGAKKLLFQLEQRRVAQLENKLLKDSLATLVVSQEEVSLLDTQPGSENCFAIPNGVDTDYFSANHATSLTYASPSCVFVGALDYLPNVEGTIWFCKHVWPKVIEKHPQAEFHIVGRQPTKSLLALQSSTSIKVHADVPDVRPYLAAANVVVAPLQIARGIQNKVLEAMAMAKAVVASPEARTGIDAHHDHHLLVAQSAEQWIGTLNNLLNDPQRQDRLGSAARHFVVQHHNWEACLKPLDALLPQVVSSPSDLEVAHA